MRTPHDKEIKEWLAISHLFPEDKPLVVNLDTSTEEGRRWRMHTINTQNAANHLKNLENKYRETGDKRYAVGINNITGLADNLPIDDK